MSNNAEAMIKEARAQVNILREDAERSERETDVLTVSPFGDDDELLLAWGKKYRMEKPDQVLVRLKVDHSGLGTLNNQRSDSKFVE